MSEKLCLQWNDFKENATSAFGILREDNDFADVTLACEDGKQFEAHKVILASSSPFFQNILRRNKHPHPLIYMRGLKSEDLVAILDFLYCGEAKVYQENLDSFLAIAEELQLKGLTGKTNDNEIEIEQAETPKKRKVPVDQNKSNISSFSESPPAYVDNQIAVTEYDTSVSTMAFTDNYSEVWKELDNKSNSMMVKTASKSVSGNPLYKCKVCGKEAENSNLKCHIEANHLEGVSIPCKQCQKMFCTKKSLANHKYVHHKQNLSR